MADVSSSSVPKEVQVKRPGNKAIFWARCPNLYKEAIVIKENNDGIEQERAQISIGKIKSVTLDAFMNYIYSDELSLKKENEEDKEDINRELADLARKYDLPRLLFLTGAKLEDKQKEYKEPTLSKDIAQLFNNELFSDVEFHVKDKKIVAHKCILAARSEYFRAIFVGAGTKMLDVEDQDQNQKKKITVPECAEEKSLADFIYYLYTNTLRDDVDVNTCIELLEIANYYQVDSIQDPLTSKISPCLETDNLAYVWNVAKRTEAKRLERTCFQKMTPLAKGIVETQSFKDLSATDKETLQTAWANK